MKIGRYATEPPKYQPHAIAHGRAPISSAYRGEADMNRRQEPTKSVENDPERKLVRPVASYVRIAFPLRAPLNGVLRCT